MVRVQLKVHAIKPLLPEVFSQPTHSQFRFIFQSLESSGHFSNQKLCAATSALGQQFFYSMSSVCGISINLQKNEEEGLLSFNRKKPLSVSLRSQLQKDRIPLTKLPGEELYGNSEGLVNFFYEDALIKNYILGMRMLKKEYNEHIHLYLIGLNGKEILG